MSVELRAGVGTNRPNRPQDVALVQILLGIAADGVFGPVTASALASFQQAQFGFTDGFVDPCDITYKRLRGGPKSVADDTFFRVLVLQAVHEGDGITGTEPIDTRMSADGLGNVTTWPDGPGGVLFIHSHPLFGTWEVRGAIAIAYQQLGEESGDFGNPISGERDLEPGPGRVSWFERGRIEFTPAGGTETILL